MAEVNLLWGTYTWILFHWMAENIKTQYFQQERTKIIHLIHTICSQLPCPHCREHAIQYLKDHNIQHCASKDDLRYFLYHFHNSVNVRGNREYKSDSVLKKYKIANLRRLLDSWNHHFAYGTDIQRKDFMAKINIQKLKQETIDYIMQNKEKFELS